MLLEFTKKGIYCDKGKFYIDPTSAVDYALITHAHSDHARRGSKNYLAHKHTTPLLRLRLGQNINVQSIEYNVELKINDVTVTFFPSGHVIGSAQIRVTDGVETWVVTGDYKLESDGITHDFEHIKCTHFVTESTFAKPNFKWQPQSEIFYDINNWWNQNKINGITSVITAYAIGKSQRLLANLDVGIDKIFVDSTINDVNNVVKEMGFRLPKTHLLQDYKETDLKGGLIIVPSVKNLNLFDRSKFSVANASGWMQDKWFTPKTIDKGFVLSDHADWPDLLTSIKNSKANNIFVTHGFTTYFAKHLNTLGYNAVAVKEKNFDQLSLN